MTSLEAEYTDAAARPVGTVGCHVNLTGQPVTTNNHDNQRE
jgi:hypothetical protein